MWSTHITNSIQKDSKEYKILLELLRNNQNRSSVQMKVQEIESEYLSKLEEIRDLCIKKDDIEKLTKENSLKILQKELDIIKLLTKYSLQNNQLDYDFIVNCLKLLLVLSDTLKTRINQKDIIMEKKMYTNDSIGRCSYKFCTYKDNCVYNYNSKSKILCYQDHYVHNMVSCDLKILIDYTEFKYGDSKIVSHNKEILKTINTLAYVINHMENELKTKCLYNTNNNNIEQWHFVKYK
jgi:hypothetical protein